MLGTAYITLSGDLAVSAHLRRWIWTKLNTQAMGWFIYHPTLQSLSIATLVLGEPFVVSLARLQSPDSTVGITPLQPPPSNSAVRSAKFDHHHKRILRITAPLLLLGTSAMWWNKHVHSAPHFTTWHAWLGLTSVGWMVSPGLLFLLVVITYV